MDASREDGTREIQRFAASYSLTIALFLACVVVRILRRTPDADFARNSGIDVGVFLLQATYWKAIHRDFFRPPRRAGIPRILVGSGAQILCMFLRIVCARLSVRGIGFDLLDNCLKASVLALSVCEHKA